MVGRILRRVLTRKRGLIAVLGAALGAALSLGFVWGGGTAASAAPAALGGETPGAADGLGQLSGLLPRNKLTTESALQVDLTNETVRLPLYPGTAYAGTPHAEKV